ncbi:TetR/AcrR family transcriptional regulator [Psychromonas sp. psych-6C06]|uniref:TetR/AcrR family transcriptional regulator n=1 Tax=Psychromonas sp. psych-6C06 TaxID=2058089 RepID=UPI000C342168|nr:TetR/AcrR family transcriptional regulator [Psychromonas sp. psych-6C06]PKF62782.1 TetR/AcrR family transcriptional regulator [Psychromonas sp. psych-6C06]
MNTIQTNKTQTRKAREVADREQLLLNIALEIIEAHGFSALTMDKLTQQSEYSKGTVYNHFSSKEDLLTALCLRAIRVQQVLYNKLVDFGTNSREQVVGFAFAYELFAKLYPALFMVGLTVKTSAIREKASPQRGNAITEAENEMIEMMKSLAKNAIDANELDKKYADNLYQVTFSIWCMGFGTVSLMRTLGECGASSCMENICVHNSLLYHVSLLLDGLGWQPLNNNFDYTKTWETLKNETFAAEIEQLRQ